MATYKKMSIVVPVAEVDTTLPPTMTFYVDTRFTTVQANRLKAVINVLMFFWAEHYAKYSGGYHSRYQNCVDKYAHFNLSPVWYEEKLATGAAAAAVQMDGFTQQIIANGFGLAPKAYIMYQVPASGTNFTIKGVNASDPEKNSLSITANPKALNRVDLSDQVLSGSLQHAWLHREGYRHPLGKYSGYFSGEASMCIMRGNNNKAPGDSDPIFYQFLD